MSVCFHTLIRPLAVFLKRKGDTPGSVEDTKVKK